MPTFNCANPPCGKEFYSKHSTARYCGRRCSGTANMNKAGVRERHRESMRKYTDEFLINRLIEQAGQLGKTPGRREVRNPPSGAYERRFGSYTNAVLLAGLIPNRMLPAQYLERNRRSVSLSLRFKILKRDNFCCQYCGGTPQEGYILHVDHVTPVAEEGESSEENLITACWLCNSGKGATPLAP